MKPAAQYKTTPEDFFVAEILGFSPSGEGEHLWLYIEKSGMNTAFVKRKLAELSGAALKDISHSGLKDRHAVTRQWLCLPAKYSAALPAGYRRSAGGEYFEILEASRHNKKLRIGTHKQNSFAITLRGIAAPPETIEPALEQLRGQGFPNYFGPQRFGQKNLEEALAAVRQNRLPRKPDIRGRILSTLRSEAYNRQLNNRLADGSWRTPLLGDCLMLAGTRSRFYADSIDAALLARAADGDLNPAGWLPGKGSRPDADAGAHLEAALDGFQDAISFLLAHCDADYRPFCVIPDAMNWQWQDSNTLILNFILPAGSYATALLDTLFNLQEHDRSGS